MEGSRMLPSTFARTRIPRASVDKSACPHVMPRIIATLLVATLLTACVAHDATAPARESAGARPVGVQGAMGGGVRKLAPPPAKPPQEKNQGWTLRNGPPARLPPGGLKNLE